jgi:hypothetical protein
MNERRQEGRMHSKTTAGESLDKQLAEGRGSHTHSLGY